MFRRARIADAEAIGRFQTRAWEQAYRGLVADEYLDATTWQVRAARWRDRMASGERKVWLAEVDRALVGVASTEKTDAHRSDLPATELASIYVDSAWHGRGVGSQLLECAIGDLPAHLWVFDANARAQRFYATHGFLATAEAQVDRDTRLGETRWVRGV
ncbi:MULTISPECIES: GNAT family N-acetyltransferase [Microbacterium]|uniref:GNAT family N-acetyltransferase n=1 Tax=Microbacterium TaxID=33882 RepID=UPI0027899D41|nr:MULTISPECIES: GNAT family N-acetyltransferase [Microbacterium]MDQ1084876.1 L-amino acid N-acyltransferase YncA [Microbacterium sp. SORGH_AS_0344]MDQ1169845.1 L-amino acid N-acyltransferase YncA [Microbacterium proteolyticum]